MNLSQELPNEILHMPRSALCESTSPWDNNVQAWKYIFGTERASVGETTLFLLEFILCLWPLCDAPYHRLRSLGRSGFKKLPRLNPTRAFIHILLFEAVLFCSFKIFQACCFLDLRRKTTDPVEMKRFY